MDGGARQVSITPDGSYITAGTRGGGAGGGQFYVFSRSGTVLFSRRTAASQSGSTYVGPNGADPEVWFTRVSADGSKAVYAGFSGAAYFLRTQ
ncbi:MAG: hypothetical protein HY703_01180 [Gemmatimonadetes bacterium]|nr:hypothetical protein [Gemmatimonadota bacterium]